MKNPITIKQIIINGKHPVMDNPHNYSDSQVQEFVDIAGKHKAPHSCRAMYLQHLLEKSKETA